MKQNEDKILLLEARIRELEASMEDMVKSQEAEYKRVSIDLHDELGQSLTSVLIRLKTIQQISDPEAVKASLCDLTEIISNTLTEVRRLSRDLKPVILETMGLIPAVEAYVENFEKQTGIKTFFKYNAERIRFPNNVEITLYRILQEATNNIAKHSGAGFAAVTIGYLHPLLILSIRDNGIGMKEDAPLGLGMIGMRERTRLLHGEFILRHSQQKGVHIVVKISV